MRRHSMEAASPVPDNTATKSGPITEAALAMEGDVVITSMSSWMMPQDFIPATKILAATMMPKMAPNESPMPLKKAFEISPGLVALRALPPPHQ